MASIREMVRVRLQKGETPQQIAKALGLRRNQVTGAIGALKAEAMRLAQQEAATRQQAEAPKQETVGEFLLTAAHGNLLSSMRQILIAKAMWVANNIDASSPATAREGLEMVERLLSLADDILARLIEYARMDENGRIA